MNDHKQIDLDRSEYRSEEFKKEPFFGPGWPFGVAALATILIGTLVHDASATVHIFGAIGGAVVAGIFQQFYR